MSGAVFRGINLKLPAGAFRDAVRRESPRRTQDGQPSDPTGPVRRSDYGSDDYMAALGTQPVLITPDNQSFIMPPGSTPVEHPDTVGVIGEWDRDGIVRRFVGRKDWSAAVKPSAAEAAEWDHVQFSLSRQEGEQATPEQIKTAVTLLVEMLRTPPLRFTRDGDPETFNRWLAEKRITRGDVLGIDGHRMIHVLPIHDNTDNVHIQAFVHRHSIDVGEREVGAAIKQHEPVVSRGQVAALNALFETNGLPFRVTNGFERVNAGAGATLDTEQAAELIGTIEAAGGTAPARLTTGQHGQLAGVIAVPSVAPEAQRISASIDEDAQALARMKAEMDALAGRIAAKQHAVAAIQEAQVARAAQAAAEAEVARLTDDLSIEVERGLQAEDRADTAERRAEAAEQMAGERYVVIEDLTGRLSAVESHARGEPERQAAAVEEAVVPLREALEAVQRQAESEPARTAEAVSAAVEPLRAELADERVARERETAAREAMAVELAKERQAREHAEAEVQTLPDMVRDALVQARQAWEQEILAPMRDQVAELRADLADVKSQLRDALAALAGRARETAGALRDDASTQPETAQRPRQPRAGADFATVAPENWTTAQRTYAQRALEHYVQQGSLVEGTGLNDFGVKANQDWRRKNEQQPDQQPPGTPRRLK